MKKFCFILLTFFLMDSWTVFVGAQHSNKDKNFLWIAKTTDLLYISDTIIYMMSKSPLEAFPGYKDLYDSYKLGKRGNVFMITYGIQVGGHSNATYQVIWSLKDSTLFMSDIHFYGNLFCKYKSVFPNNEQYKLMEGLTGVKFDKAYPPLAGDIFRHRNTIGMMPATWFSDTILIKLSRGQSTEGDGPLLPIFCEDINDTIFFRRRKEHIMDADKWNMIPSEELVFRNGKLISRETTNIY